jgi:hypothetical protein
LFTHRSEVADIYSFAVCSVVQSEHSFQQFVAALIGGISRDSYAPTVPVVRIGLRASHFCTGNSKDCWVDGLSSTIPRRRAEAGVAAASTIGWRFDR